MGSGILNAENALFKYLMPKMPYGIGILFAHLQVVHRILVAHFQFSIFLYISFNPAQRYCYHKQRTYYLRGICREECTFVCGSLSFGASCATDSTNVRNQLGDSGNISQIIFDRILKQAERISRAATFVVGWFGSVRISVYLLKNPIICF